MPWTAMCCMRLRTCLIRQQGQWRMPWLCSLHSKSQICNTLHIATRFASLPVIMYVTGLKTCLLRQYVLWVVHWLCSPHCKSQVCIVSEVAIDCALLPMTHCQSSCMLPISVILIMQLCIAVLAVCPLFLISKRNLCYLSSVCLQAQYARVSSTLALLFVPMHMIGKAWQPILPIQRLGFPNGNISMQQAALVVNV